MVMGKFPLGGGAGVDELLGGRIAVAVGQELESVPIGGAGKGEHLPVFVKAVSPVSVISMEIGGGKPGGPPLGGPVQKDLAPANPQPAAVFPLDGKGKGTVLLQGRIADHIRPQPSLLGKLL